MATLTISFTTDNNPTNGYVVKYRQVGTEAYTTVAPNPMSSPILITGLGSGLSYEGTIQGDCGGGQYGAVSTFSATVAARFDMARDPSSSLNACGLTNFNYTFYSATINIQVGTQLYADENLSSPLTIGGFYSDGTNVYNVSSAGVIIAVSVCNVIP